MVPGAEAQRGELRRKVLLNPFKRNPLTQRFPAGLLPAAPPSDAESATPGVEARCRLAARLLVYSSRSCAISILKWKKVPSGDCVRSTSLISVTTDVAVPFCAAQFKPKVRSH